MRDKYGSVLDEDPLALDRCLDDLVHGIRCSCFHDLLVQNPEMVRHTRSHHARVQNPPTSAGHTLERVRHTHPEDAIGLGASVDILKKRFFEIQIQASTDFGWH